MQKSNSTAIIGVIVFGIIAVGLTVYALRGNNPTQPPQAAPSGTTANATTDAPAQTYFVAARQILPRTRITRDMLVEQQSNGQPIPQNAITDPYQVVGKLANSIIEPGQTITGNSTVQPVARVIPANIPVPSGLRAVAVWVNPQETAAGLVDVGDRVDLISTTKLKGSTATNDAVEFVSGRTIAQDLQVLAVDRSINTPQAGNADDSKQGSAAAKPSDNADANRTRVIVAATSAQAQRIAAANEAGTLHVVIRNPGDSAVLPTGEALEYPVHLISKKAAAAASAPEAPQESRPAPAPPQYASFPRPEAPQTAPALPVPTQASGSASPFHEVTVIRGTEKTQVAVPK